MDPADPCDNRISQILTHHPYGRNFVWGVVDIDLLSVIIMLQLILFM